MHQIYFNAHVLYKDLSLKYYFSLLLGLTFLSLVLSASVKFQPALHEKATAFEAKTLIKYEDE